ncbi:e3 ubiquitin- ligase mgrn1-like protein [Rutstroemia sp. NJR-2017a BVV2]|nr:e3 ubiquitin- ligase mgrn1-like protein [Rutstroemia sp. NJR-2017a BVV2]
MRPTTPNYNFAPSVVPSSPPETPTSSSFAFKMRRPFINFSRPMSQTNGITPNGTGPHFSYTRPNNLSPRSSSPSSELSRSPSPPHSLSSGAPQSPLSSPRSIPKIVEDGNFTLEEITSSDFEEYDSDYEELIIRPHQYEDAESERAPSIHSVQHELDPDVLRNLRDLEPFLNDEQESLDDHEEWVRQQREEKRRRRRSSVTVQKRNFAQSIGSDTDDEDIQPDHLSANEAGSSARRLRRKVGDRMSLIFDDPPPRILEVEEPESCEEVVDGEGEDDDPSVLRELPYYVLQEDMDLDSS